ncbi:uncharacterized protein NEMAJ01_1997 [Nematocida major]|uniref:uncharacterized protein n=1 Tax=Nematocida major TaxID=1912982 RepID=UPI002008E3CF|nr:uncharacterized protein NEMAJ01_1997 [Nematocida major]KAH9387101.1 hypothetical protein NEMAJ01_1997 [Nematocida major]
MKEHIKLLVLCFFGVISARLSFWDILNVQKTKIGDTELVANTEGPLNLTRGYIYHQQGFMHNKRFFSPEIQTSYSVHLEFAPIDVEGLDDSDESSEVYVCTRTPVKDWAYMHSSSSHTKFKSNKGKLDYLTQYHRQLIKMFPSATGVLSIEAGRANSLLRFLRAEHVRAHALHILAALLLLSEGADVPIECAQNKIVLKQSIGPPVFSLSIKVPVYDLQKNCTKVVSQYEAVDAVQFFKANRKLRSCDPSTLEELATGSFLNSPQFLIQAYIFDFIESVQDGARFISIVHELITDLLCAKKTQGAPPQELECLERLFKKLFSSCVARKDKTCAISALEELQRALETTKKFPFLNECQMPVYKKVPIYIRKTRSFETGDLNSFSNCAEMSLYSLFCCLAYNPSTSMYCLDAMPGASPDLQWFFSAYKTPLETTPLEVQIAWNRVVSDLPCKRIVYVHRQNEIRWGLLNFLMVVVHVAGLPVSEKNTISAFIEEVNTKQRISNATIEEIKKYTKKTLADLSLNKNVEVSFRSLAKATDACSNKADLSGEIHIKHTYKKTVRGIVLDLRFRHSSAKFLHISEMHPESELRCFADAAGVYRKKANTHFGVLLAHYINQTILSLQPSSEKSQKSLLKAVQSAQKDASINRLFMLQKIDSQDFKEALVEYCTLFFRTHAEKRPPNHPITQLVSNILGSVSLANEDTLHTFLAAPVFAGDFCVPQTYPNIKLSEKRKAQIFKAGETFSKVVMHKEYAALAGMAEEFMQKYATVVGTPMRLSDLLNMEFTMEQLFGWLFRDNREDCAHKAAAALQGESREEDRRALNILWLAFACSKKAHSLGLVQNLYDAVASDPENTDSSAVRPYCDCWGDVPETLERYKEALSKRHGENQFQSVLRLFK